MFKCIPGRASLKYVHKTGSAIGILHLCNFRGLDWLLGQFLGSSGGGKELAERDSGA